MLYKNIKASCTLPQQPWKYKNMKYENKYRNMKYESKYKNMKYENIKASCTLPQQPWKYFHYVAGIILSSNIHPWHQHIIDCLCVPPSISSLSWSSSIHDTLHEYQGLTLSSPGDQWCRSHRHRTFETPSAIFPPRFLSIITVALENY